jgi:hypothetical protein
MPTSSWGGSRNLIMSMRGTGFDPTMVDVDAGVTFNVSASVLCVTLCRRV